MSDEMRQATGWLIRYGQRDLEGDIFTSETNYFIGASGRKSSIPILYEHGMDSTLGLALLGEGSVTVRNEGLWIDATLKLPPMLGGALKRLSRDHLLGWSSGAGGHTVTPRGGKSKPNYIRSWGIVEASLTTRPAMPLMHSHVMIKKFDPDQYVTELQVSMALNQYERIAERIGRMNHVAI